MNKQTIIGILIVLCTGINFYSSAQWVAKSSIPGGAAQRDGAVSWVIGSKCYVVGGNGHDDLMEYDPANDHWTARASIPQGITMFGMGFVCNGKGYLCGGNGPNFTYYQSLWEYDPDFNQWTPRKDFPAGKRASGCAFSIGDKGYVGCGDDSTYIYSDFYKYDPLTDDWYPMPAFAGGYRSFPYAFSIGDKGFIGGGWQLTELNDLWQYDTLSNAWIQRSSLPGDPRECAASFSSGEYGYVGLGQAGFSTTFDDMYKFDPIGNSWSPLPVFAVGGRAWPTGFAYGSSIYITTGWDFSTFYNDLYQLDFSTGINSDPESSAYFNAYFRQGKIVVDYKNKNNEPAQISLIDMQGRIVKTIHSKNEGNDAGLIFLETEGINSGIYILNFQMGNTNATCKLSVY